VPLTLWQAVFCYFVTVGAVAIFAFLYAWLSERR